jgi:hypothetical protein
MTFTDIIINLGRMDSYSDFDYTNESSTFGGDGKLCGIVELQNSEYKVQILFFYYYYWWGGTD